ncbi:hypothetical protein KIK06_01370 [Nocardiopsis sp. EMB25]|uniref:hypothetical protein n=1 Tax=Nocardiopsis sp. EMB25 TaxID=2835867 RepID=UPI002283EF60|nr:hypothetical protein [Nocardiopsis sp. EMB25]MCY9782537.1 hypothetical protein [Nocardiopsis sp. EMB25]
MDFDKRVYSWKHIWNQKIRQDPHSQHSPDDYTYDGDLEARGVAALYEMRGLIIGQAAQIEDLLGAIVVERRSRARVCRHSPDSRERHRIDDVFDQVATTFCELGLCTKFEKELSLVKWALEFRDLLTGTVISYGFSNGPNGLEHVVNMSMDVQGRGELGFPVPPGDEAEDWFNLSGNDPDELEYVKAFHRTREALEAAVDLWIAFDDALPETPMRRLL